MEQSDSTTGCYQCGSEEGSPLKLCPGCIEENNRKRLSLKQNITVDTEGLADPFLYKVINIPPAQRVSVLLLFVLLLVGSVCTAAIAGLAFSVIFLLLTGIFALILIGFSLMTLLAEAFFISKAFGVLCTVVWPAVALMAFVHRERFRNPETITMVRTMIGAHLVGWLLFATVVASSKIVGVKLLNPATYWRAAAPNEVPLKAPAPFARHFD